MVDNLGELWSMITEYLKFGKFEETARVFEKEIKRKGKSALKSSRHHKSVAIHDDFLNAFESGDYKVFFELWYKNITPEIRDFDPAAQKLEFYLHIHFTVYPLKFPALPHDKSEFEKRIAYFKDYLETRGATLSQTTEFLPYYALPFVPNPQHHPSFQKLFQDSWKLELGERLENFLTMTLNPSATPRLLSLFMESGKYNKEMILQMQLNLAKSERNTALYMRKFEKLQVDHHKVMGVTAELADALETTVHGKMISPEYLQDVYTRLFSTGIKQSIDFTRPGTASSMLRASVALQRPLDVPLLPSLDYEKLKRDLVNGSDRLKALLLQALRWRLTQSLNGEQKETVLQAYISNDLLERGSSEENTVLYLLRSKTEIVRQYTARLVNAFASLYDGRMYLSQIPSLLTTLLDCLRSEGKESKTRDNVLAALQKLSLRRDQQSAMIRCGVVDWLITELQKSDCLTDYTLEYAISLLMNLCLRTQGKKRCAENARQVLKVLTELLGHVNHEIRHYVNGTLYSILALPRIQEEAKRMSMEEILQCHIKEGSPELNRQMEFIIKQLNSACDPQHELESDDEDDSDDDDDEEDIMEDDLDKDETLQPLAKEISGESLLTTEYLGIMTNMVRGKRRSHLHSSASADKPLQRPSTPGFHKTNRVGVDGVKHHHHHHQQHQHQDPHHTLISSSSRPETAESVYQALTTDSKFLYSSVESDLLGSSEKRSHDTSSHFDSLSSDQILDSAGHHTHLRPRLPPLAPQFSSSGPQRSSSRHTLRGSDSDSTHV